MKRLTTFLFATITALCGMSQTYLAEDFNSPTGPSTYPSWTNVDSSAAQNGETWRFDNPGARAFNAPITSPAAILDSDWYGFSNQDAYLESPVFNTSTATTVFLDFDHFFRQIGGSFGLVEVFDGSNWITVDTVVTSTDPDHYRLDITSYVAGISNAQVRFGYVGSYSWYWIIDNVEVTQPAPTDIKVLSVDSTKSSCGLTANELITATVTNVGSSNISSGFNLNYTINGTGLVTESVPIPLNVNDTIQYTFTSTANFSTTNNYEVTVYSNSRLDGNPANDTARGTYIMKPSVSSFPYIEDFELGTGGWTSGGTASSWAHGAPGGTIINSASSGVNAWVTNLTGTYNNNEASYVTSPCFDFSGLANPQIKLMIWIENEDSYDGAVLQSSIDGGLSWQKVGSFGDPNNWYNDNGIFSLGPLEPSLEGWTGDGTLGTNGWVLAEHRLTGLAGEPSVELRIVQGTDGSVTEEGFGFDDIIIEDAPPSDVGVVSIDAPITGCGLGAADSVTVSVANFGSAAVSGFDISYSINGGSPIVASYRSTIQPNDTIQYTFNTTANLSTVGTYTIVAYTTLIGDGNLLNDTTIVNITNVPVISSLPYNEDFENGTGGWITGGANSSWEHGAPLGTYISAAAGGTSAWVTNLSGNYNNDEDSYLESPCFDFSSLTIDPRISFDHIFQTESCCDEGWLEYSFDGGITWNKLTDNGGAQEWYNDMTNLWWDGNSSAGATIWVKAENVLTGFAGESSVKFRFILNTDGSVIDEGFGVDNISIILPSPLDAGVVSIDAPLSECGLGNDSVKVSITNFGYNPISNFDVSYTINGGTPITSTYTGTIQPNDTVQYTFNSTANFTVSGAYAITAYSSLASDGNNLNDTTRQTVVNRPIVALPFSDDFESGSANIAFEFITNPESKVNVYQSAANASLFGLGLEGNSANNYATPTAANVWTTNPEHFAAAEICLDLSNVTAAELTYDLQQGFNFNDFYTNFRVTVDGIQVGPTHRPNGSTTPWMNITETISQFAGDSVLLAFESMVKYDTLSPNYNWIDNINIQVPDPFDASVTSIDAPISGCGLGNDSVKVSIANLGSNSISNFDVSYSLNGGTAVTETFTNTILPGDTAQHTFTSTANLSTFGNYSIVSYTELTNDADLTNDTTSTLIDNIPVVTSLPYNENFDVNNGGWTTYGANSSWAHGTPLGTYITAAASGSSAWVTNLTGDYNNSEMSYLESPCFDFSFYAIDPILSFSHIYQTESCCDEGWVEYSIDGGNTWTKLSYNGAALEWYNDSTNLWWDGSSSAGAGVWVTAEDTLSGLGGESQVKLRFAFQSDGSVTDDGFGVDDIAIIDPLTVGLDEDLKQNSSFNVFPNPSNGLFTVSISNKMEVQTIEINDVTGKLVHELSPNRNSLNYDLDLNHLPKGVYMLKVRGKEATESSKLIIQ